jgi:zinc transporter 1/2/3
VITLGNQAIEALQAKVLQLLFSSWHIMSSSSDFDPSNVDLATANPAQVICALNASGNDYNGHLGARISALFVIMIVSTIVTFFPVLAKRVRWLKIPLVVYLFARYFGAGVIVATAFIHLLDPAYSEIGYVEHADGEHVS